MGPRPRIDLVSEAARCNRRESEEVLRGLFDPPVGRSNKAGKKWELQAVLVQSNSSPPQADAVVPYFSKALMTLAPVLQR